MSNFASDLPSDYPASKSPWLPGKWLRLGLILLLLGMGVWGVRRSLLISTDRASSPVLTQPVERKTLPVSITVNGTVEAERSINLSPKTAGIIKTLLVQEGDRVQQGQIVAVMDDTDLRGQLTQAQGQLAQQEANLQRLLAGDRPEDTAKAQARLNSAQAEWQQAAADVLSNQQLYEAGAISRQSYQQAVTAQAVAQAAVEEAQQTLALSEIGTRQEDLAQARAQVQAAQGSLQTIQSQLSETDVLAPFDGIVVKTYADIGSFVSPSMAGGSGDSALSSSILAIASDQLRVVVQLSESQIAQVKPGQPVQFEADALPDQVFTGQVEQIAPQATVSQNVTSFEVRVAIAPATSAQLAIGMNVEAKFEVSRLENALLVPNAAIIREAQGTGVYVVSRDGEPVFQPIQIGLTADGQTEVKSGLQGGEQVLMSPPEPPASKPAGLGLPEPPE